MAWILALVIALAAHLGMHPNDVGSGQPSISVNDVGSGVPSGPHGG